MDQPVQGPGTNYRRLFRKKPTSAQIVKQAFDHPFMGDHENPFPSPFFTCIDNRLQAPVPHPASILSARGTKIPSGFFLLSQKQGRLPFKLGKGLSRPFSPILFPEPWIALHG